MIFDVSYWTRVFKRILYVVFILLGFTNITGWYFTELQPKLRREGKYKKIEAGVKPEDFVK